MTAVIHGVLMTLSVLLSFICVWFCPLICLVALCSLPSRTLAFTQFARPDFGPPLKRETAEPSDARREIVPAVSLGQRKKVISGAARCLAMKAVHVLQYSRVFVSLP